MAKFLPYFTELALIIKKKPVFKNRSFEADYMAILDSAQPMLLNSQSALRTEAKAIIESLQGANLKDLLHLICD